MKIESLGNRYDLLLAGYVTTRIGSQVTSLALPAFALLNLHASPMQVSALAIVNFLPFAVLGPKLGKMLNVCRDIPLALFWVDVARMVTLVTAAGAAAIGRLTMLELFFVAAIVSCGEATYQIGFTALVPTVVSGTHLPVANARMRAAISVSEISGNGIAGVLFATVGVAKAVGADAISYAVSAITLLLMRNKDARSDPQGGEPEQNNWRLGFLVLFESVRLRTLTLSGIVFYLANGVLIVADPIFAYRQLGFSPALLATVLTFTNVGFLSALLTPKILTDKNTMTLLVGSMGVFALAFLTVWLSSGFTGTGRIMAFAFGYFMFSVSGPVHSVIESMLQQTDPKGEGKTAAIAGAYGSITMSAVVIGLALGGLISMEMSAGVAVLFAVAAAALAATMAGVLQPRAFKGGRSRSPSL